MDITLREKNLIKKFNLSILLYRYDAFIARLLLASMTHHSFRLFSWAYFIWHLVISPNIPLPLYSGYIKSVLTLASLLLRSEERRVGKSVVLEVSRMII